VKTKIHAPLYLLFFICLFFLYACGPSNACGPSKVLILGPKIKDMPDISLSHENIFAASKNAVEILDSDQIKVGSKNLSVKLFYHKDDDFYNFYEKEKSAFLSEIARKEKVDIIIFTYVFPSLEGYGFSYSSYAYIDDTGLTKIILPVTIPLLKKHFETDGFWAVHIQFILRKLGIRFTQVDQL